MIDGGFQTVRLTPLRIDEVVLLDGVASALVAVVLAWI